MTKVELAGAVGISPRLLSMYENDHVESPPQQTLEMIVDVLGFPLEFLKGDNIEPLDKDNVSFRSHSKMTFKQAKSAIGASVIALYLSRWIGERFDLPEANIPHLRDQDPEPAAACIRQYWGLGEKPIKNITHLLESKGVKVFSLAENNKEVDAYSFWKGGTPFIFINTIKSSEHNRFDCGHELAHLAIHAHASPHGREAEQQADQFASAFLMPKNAIRSMAPSFASLGNLMKLKTYWGVSLSALIRRLKDLGLVSKWHYRSLNIDLARRGYHTNEPQSIPRETSQVLNKVFDNLLREGITKHDIARDLKVLPGEIEGLVFRLATISIDGKGAGQKSAKPKPNLKIVT